MICHLHLIHFPWFFAFYLLAPKIVHKLEGHIESHESLSSPHKMVTTSDLHSLPCWDGDHVSLSLSSMEALLICKLKSKFVKLVVGLLNFPFVSMTNTFRTSGPDKHNIIYSYYLVHCPTISSFWVESSKINGLGSFTVLGVNHYISSAMTLEQSIKNITFHVTSSKHKNVKVRATPEEESKPGLHSYPMVFLKECFKCHFTYYKIKQ
jgi:hypothetical protein